ncbi:hypothetical protein KE627_00040 [Lentilactobacillus buchneri]|nr:hypothetical protein [Lentilactobacillus buchneri]KRK67977.1 hypothetical protein FC79_GL001106 [Lentilactobacillus buchneri DSM 20057]MCT3253473.1 hypothetical protein [Lentilactobacillus buchneri]MCT3548065.1 hypothetical protein [Lentilactobacillus buchneri]MCT4438533.1 hypothetical protein [Lentilactobacillus buchneri]MQM69548.1 hypothetical protein [Lentilactobacillus buchneri]
MMITFTLSGIAFYSIFLVIATILFSNSKKYFDGGISKEDIKNGIKKYFKQVKADINEIRRG